MSSMDASQRGGGVTPSRAGTAPGTDSGLGLPPTGHNPDFLPPGTPIQQSSFPSAPGPTVTTSSLDGRLWTGPAGHHAAYPTPPLPPVPSKRKRFPWWIVIVVALVVVVWALLLSNQSDPDPIPTVNSALPTFDPFSTLPPGPDPTIDSPTESVNPPPPDPYPWERNTLTPVELEAFGGLQRGDCLAEVPDELSKGAPTVECSQPHTDQVMGFVDLTQEMPERSDEVQFEISVARRCNSLKVTLPIPEGFDQGVRANYPDEAAWEDGVRVALCWVPVFRTTWTGSALDGSATPI